MKKLIGFLSFLILSFTLAIIAAIYTGLITKEDITSAVASQKSALESAIGEVGNQSSAPASQYANHIPPTGEGELFAGELPEDQLSGTEADYSFPASLYPYRAMLAAAEQAAYDQVYGNAMALSNQIPLHTVIPADSTARVMAALFYDHPELFWVETAYRYMYDTQGNTVAISLTFNETADSFETSKNRFDGVVNQIVAEARQLPSAVLQEKYVHDYLLDHVSYNLASALNQSAYSALVNGETVCAGYARAFQHIMLELCIPCYYCAGYAGEAHAWNIIKLEEDYYHVDVAWDDPVGNADGRYYYNYFNLTDQQISADHTRGDLSVQLPICSGTKFSYDNTFAEADEAETTDTENLLEITPENLGFSRSDALTTLSEYYHYCTNQMTTLGTGNHTFSMLISGKALLDEIFALTESQEAISAYMEPVVKNLSLAEYSVNVVLQAETLADGYWRLNQQVQFSGRSLPPASSEADIPTLPASENETIRNAPAEASRFDEPDFPLNQSEPPVFPVPDLPEPPKQESPQQENNPDNISS